MPAQKVAFTMPDTTISFGSFSSHSAGIQAIACYRRVRRQQQLLLSLYLKVAKYAKINNTQLQGHFPQ